MKEEKGYDDKILSALELEKEIQAEEESNEDEARKKANEFFKKSKRVFIIRIISGQKQFYDGYIPIEPSHDFFFLDDIVTKAKNPGVEPRIIFFHELRYKEAKIEESKRGDKR